MGCRSQASTESSGANGPQKVYKAPGFEVTDLKGEKITLKSLEGNVVFLDFWATWCPPCRKGIPDLISIQNDYKNDVVIIGISLDGEKTLKDVPGFVKSYGINYPIVYGDDKVVAAYGGIEGIPTAFVVDKKGNVVDKHVGLVPKDTYVNKIKELLKQCIYKSLRGVLQEAIYCLQLKMRSLRFARDDRAF